MMKVKSSLFILISFLISIGFALLSSSDSLAATITIPSDGYNTRFSMPIYPGCLFDTYNLNPFPSNPSQNVSVLLGTNRFDPDEFVSTNPLKNCNFTLVNRSGQGSSLFVSNDSSNTYGANNYISYNGSVLSSRTYSKLSGSSAMNCSSCITTSKVNFYNGIHNIDVMTLGSGSTADRIVIPAYPSDVFEGFAHYILEFDMPSVSQNVGLQFQMLNSSFVRDPNSIISDNEFNSYLINSIVTSTGDPSLYIDGFSDIFPNYVFSSQPDYVHYYIVGSVPMDGYVDGVGLETMLGDTTTGRTIHFEAMDSSHYSNYIVGNTDLSDYGFPFFTVIRSPSYGFSNTNFDGSLKFINPKFTITWCEDSSSCDKSVDFMETLTSINSRDTNAANINQNNGSSDTSFNFWDNIFMFGLTFPFNSMFNLFSNPGNCANIPTIASWVHSSDSTYCSWWPSNVVSTLTPVFGVVSLMVLFGFIVSWLRGDRAYNVFHSPGRSV